ncbi:MAG TPA: hypothetical protein VME45_13950 [Stellaceae bacterium]|nr:hypothetical protein [Stellaceae bacterium]
MSERVPLQGLPLLVYKLRTEGLSWLTRRVQDEIRMPRTALGQQLFRAARVLAAAHGRRRGVGTGPPDTLYAFYDLGVAPVSYDFLWFLVAAEVARLRSGFASIHVVIVPGPHGGLRRERADLEQTINAEARRARIDSMLLPACSLLPSVSGTTLASGREEAASLVAMADEAVFPARYEPTLPSYPGPKDSLEAAREQQAEIGLLRATASNLQAVRTWLTAHRCTGQVVAITLRGYGYTPERNSNIQAWAAFARGLDARFSPVIVPDTAQVFAGIPDEFTGLPIFPEAAVAVGLRMALYEHAFLNLGVNNGPMGLCWLNRRTRYLTFKMLSDAAQQTRADYMEFLGFELGKSLPFATPRQRWIWEDDTLEVIEREFAKMVASIDDDLAA